MTEIPTIGDVVREWRQERQISLTDFSRRTGLSKGYISELEHNKIDNPKADKRRRLAAALGIAERDILSRRMPAEVKDRNLGDSEEVQGLTPVEDGDGQALGQAPQVGSTPMATMANPALTLPDSLGVTGEIIEYLIASAHLSEEDEKQIGVEVIEYTKRLLAFRETLRKREDG